MPTAARHSVLVLACLAGICRGTTETATGGGSAATTPGSTGTPDFAEDSATIEHFYLRNHTLRALLQVPSLTVCGAHCARLGVRCRSLNYRRSTGLCELNAASRADYPRDLVAGDGGEEVLYVGRASPLVVQLKQSGICPCCENECQHGAYCVPREGTTRGHECICSSGWTGDYCENMIAQWSTWSNWSPCSASRGLGKRSRSRECAGAVYTPDSCTGDSVAYMDCWDQAPCSDWSAWTDTGPCTANHWCGYGTVDRARVCRGNRTDCPGPDSQSARCASVSCEAPWRLVGGARPGAGRLEVFSAALGSWGTVCADGWDRWDTDAACRTLGLQPPPRYGEPGHELLCDEGWQYYEGSCYWGSEPTVTFDQAEVVCSLGGANLASILTEAENTFIRAAFPHPLKLWLGADNADANGGYLTSLRWTDGSFPGFRESTLEGAVPNADERRCLSLHRAGGDWDPKPCDDTKSVVCKKSPDYSLEFGPGEGATHLARMDCRGCEQHLSQCRHGSWHDVTPCNHTQDVGLKCTVVRPTYETNANTAARFPFKAQDPAALRVEFTARTAGTVRLILSAGESLAEAVYTIILSSSSTSSIYHHASASHHDVKVIADLVDDAEPRGFWVDKTGDRVRAGRLAPEGVLLEWWGEPPPGGALDALYVGFASSQPTSWRFSSF